MEEQVVQFCWLEAEQCRDLPLPCYHSELAAGMDVAAAVQQPTILMPGDIQLIPSGFSVAIPPGYELQVRPRSGLAVKQGVTIINSPGTIDADYRGEVKIALVNLGREAQTVHRGDRVAQLVLSPVVRGRLELVESLPQTIRGAGGFGHTGV
ncbi:MAG: dUTP diphosphatase [Desulfobulbaceae bacterium]|uniref:Deoxyuridine 5'-triphosphate nucleotidohydrolase n=1 Tax=Candidatus Desulfatifera sulfidica TaxID=2841691 RepID=A0A8J6N9R5_9BACT|nr:dUTP diphosphatase [Candidatus Desulfatifera sulfidica]